MFLHAYLQVRLIGFCLLPLILARQGSCPWRAFFMEEITWF